ncbi:SIMPL domain-containing protein [Rubritalea spongiae]|uniref:SIMPL domain-containing protein n=2 Tax=Rubritalea spongiae TaxID=430797 RepID=A0ABW5E360_9BACT
MSVMLPSHGAEVTELPQVRVTGQASELVTPDEMAWSIKVENKGVELAKVAEEHASKVAELLAYLKEQKVDVDKTKTSQMEFGENWQYRDRQKVKEGYVARTSVSFRSSDFSQYKPLWLGLSKLGGVSVQSVNYQLEDREKAETKLKHTAMLDAKERASELAESLGSKIAEPLLIEERNQEFGRASYEVASESPFASSPPAEGASSAAGKLKISSKVYVVFRLVSPAE